MKAHEKIVAFLRTVKDPQTTTQIRLHTGLSRTVVSAVLWRTHPGLFAATKSPIHKRMKLWSICDDVRYDLRRMKISEVCFCLLMENDNEPMHALTMAKKAIARGYTGRSGLSGDALEFAVAASFWARMASSTMRDFEAVRDKVFRIRRGDNAE